jgi:pSer/pThr/pTyr-binding forkhead associated (FHA) protein/tetratricopeptide (TPR) repeat protein
VAGSIEDVVSSAREQAFVVIEAPNGDVREVSVGRLSIVVGRDESADIRVNDKKVSRRHIAFRLEDGQVMVEDLGSVNGIKLNGRRVDGTEKLNQGDIVSFGGYQVSLRPTQNIAGSETAGPAAATEPIDGDSISEELYAFLEPRMGPDSARSQIDEDAASVVHKVEPILTGLVDPVKDERFVLQLGENIIGRLEDCDIPILHESISRQHARISLQTGRTVVEDLDSSNGTYINDENVDSGDLVHGDTLRVGSIEFRVELPSKFVGATSVRTRKRERSSKAMSGVGGSAALVPGLILLACLIGFVSWFVEAEKPFTILSSLFTSQDDNSNGGVSTGDVLHADSDSGLSPVTPDTPENSLEVREETSKSPSDDEPKSQAIVTATSPFGRRDSSGWPLDLPTVSEDVDFDGFVQDMLVKAEQKIDAEEYVLAEETLNILSDKDPVNAIARKLKKKLTAQKKAGERLKEAERLEKSGKESEALSLYKTLIDEPKFAEIAKAKIETQSKSVVQAELKRAIQESKKPATWSQAHDRLVLILKLAPQNRQARELIWEVEKKMRTKRLRFSPYRAPAAGQNERPVSGLDNHSLMVRHLGDRSLVSSANYYKKGEYGRALRSARRALQAKPKSRQGKIKEHVRALEKAKKKYDRVRTAIGNDPSEAWFYLREFKKHEEKILPKKIKSFWLSELEALIADAYAEQGEAMFVQQRYEEAFTKWDAGSKLRPEHVKIEAGFAKLEIVANTTRTEAELLMQQAKPGACDRWRKITRMTKADTEVHRLGRRMANQICN